MARTTASNVIIPEIFTDAVQARFAQKDLFFGESSLARLGVVNVSDSFQGGQEDIGKEIHVPYFGTIGEFKENVADGDAADVTSVFQTDEKALVSRDTLAFEATRWSKSSVGKDAYQEGVDQLAVAAARAMDRRVIKAALNAPGGLKLSKYSSTVPSFFNYDLMVEAMMAWGDEQDGVAALSVHSATLADLYKLRDGEGRPLLTLAAEGGLPKFLGVPVIVSDKCPVDGSATGTVTSSGTSPPAIAITTNAPLGPWNLKIKTVTAGARGTATISFSTDGGVNWSAPLLTAASMDLIDTAIDSLVGLNGKTGITISYANAASSADNVWSASTSLKATSMLLKKGAFGFWFNRQALALQTDRDILRDSDVAAMHLYAAAIRYRRLPGGTKPGAVLVEHNVSSAK